jgi:hypothetical protein
MVIIVGVPLALISVVISLEVSGLPLSAPNWCRLTMLAGIERARRSSVETAFAKAARLCSIPTATLKILFGILYLAFGLCRVRRCFSVWL